MFVKGNLYYLIDESDVLIDYPKAKGQPFVFTNPDSTYPEILGCFIPPFLMYRKQPIVSLNYDNFKPMNKKHHWPEWMK